MAQRRPLQHTALLLALASAWPLQSMAAAGVAQFTSGDVSVRRGSEQIPLAKGRAVESGDSIVTGDSGRAQVRFSDGGLVALQPNTQFNINRYADANDPRQDAFLVDLLRGGMRAITGLIGKRNRENYKITTTTATVGIRGSSFNLNYLPDGTLAISAEQDAIEVCTRAGCTGLTAGESARVVSPDQPAVRTSTRASLPVPGPTRTPTVKSEEVSGEGTTTVVGGDSHGEEPVVPTATVLTGLGLTSAGLTSSGAADQRKYLNGAVVVDQDGVPRTFLAAGNEAIARTTEDVTVYDSRGTLADGDLMILASSAGNWTTPAVNGTRMDLSTVAFVTGVATPSDALSSVRGTRGVYALTAATPVFSTNGVTGQVLPDSKLTVDFVGAGNFVDVDIAVRMPALASQTTPLAVVETEPPPAANRTDFKLTGGVGSYGVGFGGKVEVSSEACNQGSDPCGVGSVAGFFGGATAQKAALSFTAQGNAYGTFGGAATFDRSSSGAAPSDNTIENTGDYTDLKVVAAGHPSGGNWFSLNYGGNGTSFRFNGSHLNKVVNMGESTTTLERTSNPTPEFGALGKPGDQDFIGWGKWATGSLVSGGSTAVQQVHYLVGVPTVYYQMPTAGTASYDMVGGTAPTAKLGGTVVTGELVSGSLSANFTSGTAALDIATRFGSTNVNVSASNLTINGSSIASSAGATSINGFFTGQMAARAGVVYGTDNATVGRVTGAAAFQRTSSSGLISVLPQ